MPAHINGSGERGTLCDGRCAVRGDDCGTRMRVGGARSDGGGVPFASFVVLSLWRTSAVLNEERTGRDVATRNETTLTWWWK